MDPTTVPRVRAWTFSVFARVNGSPPVGCTRAGKEPLGSVDELLRLAQA